MASVARPMLTTQSCWKKLQDYFNQHKSTLDMVEMFKNDENRFEKFSQRLTSKDGDILIDYSKNLVNDDVMKYLLSLARERKVEETRDAMFRGEKINSSQNRVLIDFASRNRANTPVLINNKDVMPAVNQGLQHMRDFVGSIQYGQWKGHSGRTITDVVNIGIGGSNIGQRMVTEALQPYKCGPDIHFMSNIDGTHTVQSLESLVPETTLFIVASASFTTQETVVNANYAKKWLLESADANGNAVAKHFVAVTENVKLAKEFGIPEDNIFEKWSWARHHIWAASGLAIALHIGMDNFEDLLSGGHFMDNHFRNTPLEQNVPVLLALLGVWYNNFYNADITAILPYDQSMHLFPVHVQHSDMEQNGKHVTRAGRKVDYQTGPMVWGALGTNAQHDVFEFLHQGTSLVPCDFLLPVQTHNPIQNGLHHEILTANFLAQTEALMKGFTEADVRADLGKSNTTLAEQENILPHQVTEGNRPSTSILYQKLTPFMLGLLIVMYEHKTFVQGIIWDINSLDSFGVLLGKKITKAVQQELAGSGIVTSHDASTNGLINFIKELSRTS